MSQCCTHHAKSLPCGCEQGRKCPERSDLGGGNYYLPLMTEEKPPVPTADSAMAICVRVLIAVACIPLAGVLIGMAYAWWAK